MHDPFEDWLSQEFIDSINVTNLNHAFSSAKPFAHLTLKNLFKKDILSKISSSLESEQFFSKHADLFSFHQTNDLGSSTNDFLLSLRDFLFSKAFVGLMSKITDFDLKEGIIDLHGTLYTDTDFLLCHDDQLEGRKIAFMLYLSDLEKGDGGALELYDSENGEPTAVAERIVPQKNHFVFFEVSDTSFHAVSELIKDKQRLTLAGWFHE